MSRCSFPAVDPAAGMNFQRNRRILLVGDALGAHDALREMLRAAAPGESCGPSGGADCFEADSARQGDEGLALLQAALQERRPYALAFVAAGMPPEWDGMRTIERLWQADPRLQIVLCLAGEQQPAPEALAGVDPGERLLIARTPFASLEARQLAGVLAAKWSLARHACEQAAVLEQTLQSLHTAQAALLQSNRELEAFAHAVSHDLRAPLTVMSAFSTLLAAELGATPGAKARHYLERIKSSAAVGEQLIEGLLSLSRIARSSLYIQEVDLSALARQQLGGLARADPQRQVEATVESGMAVEGDRRLLDMALKALLSNAWKFTGCQEQPRIEVGQIQQAAGGPVFFVRDNGVGLDMAYADKLFRAFQRLHPRDAFPGHGIGLVTASRVIARHGGRVWVSSAVDQGSTFYFTLPDPPPAQTRPLQLND